MRRLLDRMRLRLRSLLRGSEMDDALKNEIRVHLEAEIEELVARGISHPEARAAAQRAFGPTDLVEEQCRDTRRVAFVEHLVQDVRYSFRSLTGQPTLVAASLLSVAIAIGANTTVFSVATSLMFAIPSARAPAAGAHSDGQRQPRLAPAMARSVFERRAGGTHRFQRRDQHQLARG